MHIIINTIYHDQPIMSYSIRRSSNQVNTMGQTTKQHKHPIITTSQLYGQLSQHGHMMAIVYIYRIQTIIVEKLNLANLH